MSYLENSVPEKPGRVKLIVAASALFIAVIVGASLTEIYVDRQKTIEDAHARLENVVRIADETIFGRLHAIDMLLQGVAAESQVANTPAEKERLRSYLRARVDSLNEVRTISITDAAGRIVFTTLPAVQDIDVRERPYYMTVKNAADYDRFFLLGPGRAVVTNATIMFAVRAKPPVNGAWDGVALASLTPDYFASVLETVQPRDGFAMLLGQDGVIAAHSPDHDGHVGDSRAGDAGYIAHVRSGARTSRADGGDFFTVWRSGTNTQLTLAAGRPRVEVLADWRRKSLAKGAALGLLAAAAVLALRRFSRHERELTAERNHARQAEQEVAASQRFIAGIADNTPGMVGYWDAGLRCRFANRAYQEWFGRPADDIIGVSMADLLGERLFAQHEAYARAALAGQPQHFERTQTLASGDIGYAWAHYMPDIDGQGRVAGFFVLVSDVTPLKRTELELRAAQERLSLATAAGGVGVWEYDLRSRELSWDDRMFRLCGHTPDDKQHVYSLWASCCHPQDLGRVEDEMMAATDGDRGFSSEFRVLPPDGGLRHIQSAAALQRDADGSPVRLIGVAWDITAMRDNATALAAAQAEAERANQAKSEFLANMSHEIRTPMNAILGLAHLLERTPLSADQQALTRDIVRSGDALLALINDILDFSRIEAGRLELEHAAFRLPAVLDTVLAILSANLGDKPVKLSVNLADDAPRLLWGDALRLQQILLNLAGNAVKFTERGEVRVEVSACGREDGRTVLLFSVTDTGVGVAPDKLSRLFDAFTQADSSTTRRFGGSGLGLAICKMLVGLMGGDIGAESRPGAGSRFWFTAPFTDAPADAANEPAGAPLSALAAAEPRLAGVRLLVVEDNAINQLVARRVLELEGATVTVLGDGQQAVAQLAVTPGAFDAVLMDIQMPVMDGCEAARRIRRDLGLTDLPIIALTAGALSEERARAMAAGIDDFVTKPFDVGRMTRRLHRLLARAPRAPENDAPEGAAPESAAPSSGLNRADALARLGGDAQLYATVLDSFARRMNGAATEIGAALDAGRWEDAARRLHALRGAAANIGADTLAETALEMENLLRRMGDGDGARDRQAELAALLDDVCAVIKTAA